MSSDSGSTDGGHPRENDEASHDALGDTHLGRSLKELIKEIGREKEALRRALDASQASGAAPREPEEDFDPSQTRFDQALELAAATARDPQTPDGAGAKGPGDAPPAPAPASPPAATSDAEDPAAESAIAEALAAFEEILRRFAEAERKRSEAQIAEWKVQLKKATMIVIKKQVDAARARWLESQSSNEAQLQAHYQRLKALADKVARQKAQIQKAKQELENKLEVADRLHSEFDEIRSVLDGQIDAIDALDADEDQETGQ